MFVERGIAEIILDRGGENMSNVHELQYLQEKVQGLKDQGVYRKLPVMEGPNEAEIILNGKKVINLSSSNYLGFANHPRIKKAAMEALEKYGVGAGAVRTIIGNMDIHEKLDEVLAEFKREEAVMHFNQVLTVMQEPYRPSRKKVT